MYKLSRFLLILAMLILLGCLLVVLGKLGGWGIIIGLSLFALAVARKGAKLWAYGTARWATAADLYRKGMLK